MGLTKNMMLEFQEAELNEYEELKDSDLNGKIENINDEITAYYEDIQEQLENLLSNDIEDEFEKDILTGSVEEITKLAISKNELLEKIARLEELGRKFNK
ncbi:hypothetical protein [Ureibacillus sinduriensis]|uniref:Uncharacterized protein n=1 Tax=Ureibacillus sinduriensis BLB-1 = JCM 15800 TaxID=1384057 RepID=A0A0A3HV02_9BACL|nr:hypothetical protein [Ureibacillus sinduriensis]KGR75055.1 hypothetical protein CD33_12300 [Ureibacillus sinduriensis BLB-1 = JCM 15800]